MSEFGFRAKVSSSDINRIVKKLYAAEKVVTNPQGLMVKFIFRAVMEDYKESIISAMGVVSADGGTVTPKTFMGMSRGITWEPLAQKTVTKKKDNRMITEIWAATGAAKQAVKIHEYYTTNTTKMFAGLQQADGAAYKHAWRTETGQFAKGRQIARPLFTMMNEVFKTATPIIVRELQKLLVQSTKWGR